MRQICCHITGEEEAILVISETGGIAALATILSQENISIKNIGIIHNREFQDGVLHIEFSDEQDIFESAGGYAFHRFRLIVKIFYQIYQAGSQDMRQMTDGGGNKIVSAVTKHHGNSAQKAERILQPAVTYSSARLCRKIPNFLRDSLLLPEITVSSPTWEV